MHFSTATIFATLFALSQAAPAPAAPETTPNPLAVSFAAAGASSVNDCGDSTFINQSSGGSPLIADCQQITRNIANGGTWEVEDFGGQHQLVQYGTCAFGVTGDKGINGFYVGNQDIIDLINDSISRFSWEGKVGSKGSMGCQSLTGLVGGVTVTWGLYHN